MTFNTHSYGKWILSGEHTVLRGGHALAFPVFSRKMSLWYESSTDDLSVVVEGEHRNILDNFIRVLLQKGCEILGKSPTHLKGSLKLHNEVPIGTGLGGSAALSVNLAKFFVALGWAGEDKVFEIARKLEDVAHGKSSGVDIATILSATGTYYHIEKSWTNFSPEWMPSLHLHFCGQRSLTAECIQQVEQLIQSDASLGEKIDADMKESVALCESALRIPKADGFDKLKEGIALAESCFERWGLVSTELAERTAWLKDQGAVAVKPAGSGGGGYLVSLWKDQPPTTIQDQLIPCFH